MGRVDAGNGGKGRGVKSAKQTSEPAGRILSPGKDGSWASYDVHPGIMYSGVTLPDGRAVQFFCNRETGLIVVDVIDKNKKGGREILRRTL